MKKEDRGLERKHVLVGASPTTLLVDYSTTVLLHYHYITTTVYHITSALLPHYPVAEVRMSRR